MKKAIGVMLLAGVVAAGAVGAGDVLQQLGLTKAVATSSVVSSIARGSVDYMPARNAMKAASPEVRAALVEQFLVWTKAYVASQQFATDYAAYRQQKKPKGDQVKSVEDELKARRADRQKQIAETQKTLEAMPAGQRKQVEPAYKQMIEMLKKWDTPEFEAKERQAIEMEQGLRREDLDKKISRWTAEYPADPKALLRTRLHEFLKETDGVDFNAKLVAQSGSQRFANSEYESKPANWKLAYRAGRPATEKARAFADQWLRELK